MSVNKNGRQHPFARILGRLAARELHHFGREDVVQLRVGAGRQLEKACIRHRRGQRSCGVDGRYLVTVLYP